MLKRNSDRFFGYLFSSFAVISGVAQTFLIEPAALRYGTFAGAIVCALAAALMFRQARNNSAAITALDLLVPASSELTVGTASTEAEVREVWRLDIDNFQDHFVPTDAGVAWWRKYSKGLYILKKDNEILGYISFWPITQKTFKEFISGKRLETEITARCISPPSSASLRTWWYLGSISLVARFRKTKAMRKLLLEATHGWLSGLDLDAPICVCALAYSTDGEKLLRKFGFHCFARLEESPHRLSVYVFESTVSEAKIAFNRMAGERSPSEA